MRARWISWALAAASLPACGPPSERCALPASSARVVWEAAPGGLAPFPGDRYTRADPGSPTGLRLALPDDAGALLSPGLALLGGSREDMRAALEELTGFGLRSPVLLPLDGPLDPDSLPATPEDSVAPGAAVFLVVAEPAGPRLPVRVEALDLDGQAVLAVTPEAPLAPGARHLLVVTRGVRAADGSPLGAWPDFAYASGRCPVPALHPQADRLRGWAETLRPLLEEVPGLELAEVAGATWFTTQAQATLLDAAWAGLEAEPPVLLDLDLDEDGLPDVYPPAETPGAPPSAPHLERVGRVLKGTLDVPELRDPLGLLVIGADGRPRVQARARVPFLLCLPADPAGQPWPIVVLQHGLSARKEYVLYLAGHLAGHGLASLAIDLPEHGEGPRRDTAFIDLIDARVTTANLLQGAVDLGRLLQAVRGPLAALDLGPGAGPDGRLDLDPTRLAYLGSSAGSMVGSLLLSKEPALGAAVLTVGGGGFEHFIDFYFHGLYPERELMPFRLLGATLLDPVDPLHAGARLEAGLGAASGGRQVLLQQVVDDRVMPPRATEDLARAVGVPLVRPALRPVDGLAEVDAPALSVGLTQFSPATHGFLLASDVNPETSERARVQAALFLATALDEGVGRIEIAE